MTNIITDGDSSQTPPRSEDPTPIFRFTEWSNRKGKTPKPLGKRFSIKGGQLYERKNDLGVLASHAEVIEIYALDGLASIIERRLQHGRAFITSGIPINESLDEAPVTLKRHRKAGYISRSLEHIHWQTGAGTYFVVDYDSKWDPKGPRSVDEIRQALLDALECAGVDGSELAMIAYESSSSGFSRSTDGHRWDKGGRHLIFLVDDAGDLDRFLRALEAFLVLKGYAYGAVSRAGRFLRRGILDTAAVSPTQPTFAGIPAYNEKKLTNIRENRPVRFLGGNLEFLNTRSLREPTQEEFAEVERFWQKERDRLQPATLTKTREWLEKEGSKLRKIKPELSDERARQILEHRRSGNLVASDVIRLGNANTSVSEILTNPDKFDGMTGPDPIEPDYRGGAEVCKIYINRSNGRPMIHSKAHGATNYWLWYDPETAVARLKSAPLADATAVARTVLPHTRFSDATELESFLKAVARALETTKKTLSETYGKTLRKNIHTDSCIDAHIHEESPSVNDIAHQVAKEFVDSEVSIITDEHSVWRYCGTHYEEVSPLYLESTLRRRLIQRGWEREAGLTRAVNDAVAATKQITYKKHSPINQSPRPIFNCRNGELHILPDGEVAFRDHDPESGLTSVLPIEYYHDARAPIFEQALEDWFLPPAQERTLNDSNVDTDRDDIPYVQEARAMRDHIEEVMAYLIVPKRWLTVWFIFIGAGSNGKTLVTKILDLLLPPEVVESDRLKAFTKDSFGMERIINKTIIIDDDLDTGTTIPDGFVKKISEEKPLSANRKNKTSVTFTNRAALLLLSNNYPRFVDVSDGMLRRVQSIPFRRRFYKISEIEALPDDAARDLATKDSADLMLIDKIRGELPGVLANLVRAYQRLVKRGDFAPPDSIKKSNERIVYESNPLPLFIKTRCEKKPDHRFKTSEFFGHLCQWIDDENLRWDVSNRQVRTMMEHLHYRVVKINGNDHYCGIQLLEGNPENPVGDQCPPQDALDDWDDCDDCSEDELDEFDLDDDDDQVLN